MGVNPVDPPGPCGVLGPPQAWDWSQWSSEGRRSAGPVGPPKPASFRRLRWIAASSGDAARHRGELMAAEWWGLVLAGERKTRPPRCKRARRDLPAPRRPPNPTTKTKSWRELDRVKAISPPAPPPLQSSGTPRRADARLLSPTGFCRSLSDASFGPSFNRTVSAPGCKARLRLRLANIDAIIAVLRRLEVF